MRRRRDGWGWDLDIVVMVMYDERLSLGQYWILDIGYRISNIPGGWMLRAFRCFFSSVGSRYFVPRAGETGLSERFVSIFKQSINYFISSLYPTLISANPTASLVVQNRDSIRDEVLLIAWDRRGGEKLRGKKKGGTTM
jgi:hypothetical protein